MKKILITFLVFLPVATFAATDLSDLFNTLIKLAGLFYKLMLALIIGAFAWGVLKFIFQSGEDQEKGKNMMIWSVVAIVVLFSIWGIVSLFQETAGLDNNSINPPQIPGTNIVTPS